MPDAAPQPHLQQGPLPFRLSRRQLLRGGLAAAALLPLAASLGGCRGGRSAELLSAGGELPALWLQRLPDGWRNRSLADPAAVLRRLPEAQLVALGDGWATSAPRPWRPLEAPALLARLDGWAQPVARLWAADAAAPAVAFPWAFSPWVLALRSRPDLAARSAEGWALLLDPSLRRRLVLPSSPRVCIELMNRDASRIAALRRHALAHDDRDGLNLLLAGQADAAVLPLRRLIPLLRRDQRLSVVLPESGAPLSWQLLLRPPAAGSGPGADAAALQTWMELALQPPLLAALLQGGWVPPLPRHQLEPLLRVMPAAQAALLLPQPAVLERCWSLPPLTPAQQLALQTVWDVSEPGTGA